MREIAFVLSCFSGLSTTTLAFAGEVELTLSGTAFKGGPRFEAALGGEIIGSNVIENPSPEGTVFRLTVNDNLLGGRGDLTIRLTNDYFLGEGQDRSLTILGARVGAVELVPGDFILTNAGEPIERDRSDGVQIWSGDDIAVANAPEGGWADSATRPTSQPAPNEAADCSHFAEVTGFLHNRTSIDATEFSGLQAIADIAATGLCSVTITGYGDETGPDLANRRITAARAAAVLDYLLTKGAQFPTANIVSTVGTSEFGPAGKANRRVAVQLWSP